jgi:hypothetical protein
MIFFLLAYKLMEKLRETGKKKLTLKWVFVFVRVDINILLFFGGGGGAAGTHKPKSNRRRNYGGVGLTREVKQTRKKRALEGQSLGREGC